MATPKKKISEKISSLIDEIDELSCDQVTRGILLQAVRFLNVARGSMLQYEELQVLTSRKAYLLKEDGTMKLMSEVEILRMIAVRERKKYNEENRSISGDTREHSFIDEVNDEGRKSETLQQYSLFSKAFTDSLS